MKLLYIYVSKLQICSTVNAKTLEPNTSAKTSTMFMEQRSISVDTQGSTGYCSDMHEYFPRYIYIFCHSVKSCVFIQDQNMLILDMKV